MFKDSTNTAVITLKKIINRKEFIGYITHDIKDRSWQFLDKKNTIKNINESAVVSLQEIIDIDSSILEIADLPLGWCAWRDTASLSWQKSKM